MPTLNRTYVRREARLVTEWLQKFHSKNMQWRQVRLGPIPNGNTIYSALRRYADAIYLDGNSVVIVEACIRPEHEKIAQLELYRNMFAVTPEFSDVQSYTLRLLVLTTLEDQFVHQLADQNGIEYQVYSPQWIKDYWKAKLSG